MGQRIKVGIFIRELRTAKGLSQVELGNLLHVTKKAVSRWETGRGLPDSSLLLPLSEILDVSVDEILQGEFRAPTELETEDRKKLDAINSFLKYCREKRNMINSFIVTFFAAISFILSAYSYKDVDFGYMGTAFVGRFEYHEFSFLTNVFLILLIFALFFTVYRIIIFLQSKIKFKKG